MDLWLRQGAIALLLPAAFAVFAQETPQDNAVRVLIEQLGDADFQKREDAEARLVELGAAAIEALQEATKSDDAEISFRARQAIRRITSLSLAEQEELRLQGQAAFYAGDYEKMSFAYRRLVQANNASIDDGRWLGHACQLGGQWKEAADAYVAVIDRMDPILDQNSPASFPADEFWPGAIKHGLQQRAAIILLTARIQRFYLNDLSAAEKTLRRIRHYNPVLNEPLDEIAKKWEMRVAEAIAVDKDVSSVGLDVQQSLSLRFPMMALRELAAVQQLNGNNTDALDTWRRIHLTTHQYVGFTESIDAAAVSRLVEDLPETPEAAIPWVTFLDEERPTAEFDLGDAAILARSYEIRQNYGTFALSATKGLEFASLEFTCDIEQLEPQYGGQFGCWTLVGEQDKRKGIGDIHWPSGKNLGRDKITKTFSIEPGTGVVHFRAGSWKDKFKVYGVRVAATFRRRASEPAAAATPIPPASIHAELLPMGGSISVDGKSYESDSTTYNIPPAKTQIDCSHPMLKAARRFTLDLAPGAHYSLFVNFESPFAGELTNLRGIDSTYGPAASFARMPDGRWLAAWCKINGGLQFASSDNLVAWSDPTTTSDSSLFNENYNCIAPTLYADKAGVIWLAYFSNQLDIDQLHSGGYRLFLRKSKDGCDWSPPRPINMPLSGWPPGNLQILNGPDGKTSVLFRMHYAVVESLDDFTEFSDLEIPATDVQRSHARNPNATVDANGRLHLVWDHFAQTLYYAQRDVEGKWSAPIEVSAPGENAGVSHPQLVVRGDEIALIYRSHQGAYLRRGILRDGAPSLGEPIKIAPHTAPLVSTAPALLTEDRIAFLCGSDTVWLQTAAIDALLKDIVAFRSAK